MIPCTKCKRPETKSYGNSRTVHGDGKFFRYMECQICHTKWRHVESRHYTNIPNFPTPKPKDIIYISHFVRDLPGFWITRRPSPTPDLQIRYRLSARGDAVSLMCLDPDQSVKYEPTTGYTTRLDAANYWKENDHDPIRGGPSFAADAIAFASRFSNPIIVIGVGGLRHPQSWRNFFSSMPPNHISFVDSTLSSYLDITA